MNFKKKFFKMTIWLNNNPVSSFVVSVLIPRFFVLGLVVLAFFNRSKESKTGERVSPKQYNSKEEYLIYLRHLFAYECVKKYESENILEIGCGEGYGANLLSKQNKVIAVDIDKEVIEEAITKYSNSNLSFMQINGKTLPFSNGSFDTIVSLQTIEHVEFPRLFLLEAKRVLIGGAINPHDT